jgi:methionyl-tRNA synthetase
MIAKAFGGVLPEPGEFTPADKSILTAADALIAVAREHMQRLALHQLLNTVWAVVADANRYFASEAPWGLAKTDPKRQGTILYVTAEVLRQVAILAQPFVPSSAAKMLDLLAVGPDERDFAALGKRIQPGRTVPAPKPVFPRWLEPEAKA